MEKKRISIVSYLNSKPFLFGINNSTLKSQVEVSLDIPAKVVAKLAYNLADIGLIPVAGLPDLEEYEIVSDYCIGAVGKVKTVVLVSDVPLNEIETVLMDYQSRTSVLLARVLAKFFWKKEFVWKNTCANFQHKSISENTAGVLIGDRVFEVEGKFKYTYDLSEEWEKFTGLPFVFAVWAANKIIPADFEKLFNKTMAQGVACMDQVVKQEQKDYPDVDITRYFTEYISYELDDAKRKGMKLFLELAKTLPPAELLH